MIYLLQVSICWIILYAGYHLLMRKETFFSVNRFYLIGTLILGLVIPFAGYLIPENQASQLMVHYNPTVNWVVTPEVAASPTLSIWDILQTVYFIGVIFMLSRLVLGLTRIYGYYLRGEKIQKPGYTLITSSQPHLPFSFFNNIFLSSSVPLDGDIKQIIDHELVHINHWHSIDTILLEVLQSFFWFNPVLLLYKKALKESHEYIADAYVLRHTDKDYYTRLLLGHSSNSGIEMLLANQFFHSQIKNRIKMMYHKRSSRYASAKYLMLLPVIAIIMLSFVKSGDTFTTQEDDTLQQSDLAEATSSMLTMQDTIPDVPPPPPPPPSMGKDIPPPPPPPPASKEYLLRCLEKGYTIYINGKEAGRKEIEQADKLKVKTLKIDNDDKVMRVGTGENSIPPPPPPPPPAHSKCTDVFKIVEQMPRFPGCEEMTGTNQEREQCAKQKMLEYIYSNLKYPEEARKKGIEGMAVIRFLVNTDGYIEDIELLRNPGGGTGEAAVKVVEDMNKMTERWIPGKQRGKMVKVLYTLPVRFKLANDTEAEEHNAHKLLIIYNGEEISIQDFNKLTKLDEITIITVSQEATEIKKYTDSPESYTSVIVANKKAETPFSASKLNYKTFDVFPNPSSGEFTVKAELYGQDRAELAIHSVDGKVFHRASLDAGKIEKKFSLEEKGMYVITITQGKKSIYSNVFIQRP